MSVFSSVLIPAQAATIKVAALTASTSSAEQFLGNNVIFAINATQDVCVSFGVSGMGAAAATDFRIPANQTMVFDCGNYFTSVRVYNVSASAADIYIRPLSKF